MQPSQYCNLVCRWSRGVVQQHMHGDWKGK